MRRPKLLIPVILVLLCLCGATTAYRWAYPYGVRTCFLPCMVSALVLYAHDHGDCFPEGGSTPQESLRKLTPSYVPVTLLAGLSGDIAGVEKALRNGEQIGDEQSSWVYSPGFKSTDGPGLAILWERAGGVKFNGGRAQRGSHAVGFADGSHRQILAADWENFLREQSRLRDEIRNPRIRQPREPGKRLAAENSALQP